MVPQVTNKSNAPIEMSPWQAKGVPTSRVGPQNPHHLILDSGGRQSNHTIHCEGTLNSVLEWVKIIICQQVSDAPSSIVRKQGIRHQLRHAPHHHATRHHAPSRRLLKSMDTLVASLMPNRELCASATKAARKSSGFGKTILQRNLDRSSGVTENQNLHHLST
ncbi:hypothetical protein Dimus_038181 [Dionaea muscipula]